MTIPEYQHRAIAGATHDIKSQPVWFYALGLTGEIGELIALSSESVPSDEHYVSELGDILFYSVVLAHLIGLRLPNYADDIGNVPYNDTYAEGMAMHAGLLANPVKKHVRDGIALDPSIFGRHLLAIIKLCHYYSVGLDRRPKPIFPVLQRAMEIQLEKQAQRRAAAKL